MALMNSKTVINTAAVDSSGRIKGLNIVKPIIFGNTATYFGSKRPEDGHTHHWTVYLRSFENEDMSSYIKKVHFKLHESYANQNRVVTKPPYEVSETGWGEFEIIVKIYFVDPLEKSITLYHLLKLFEINPETKQIITKKNVCSENYDEIIFTDPSPLMANAVNSAKKLPLSQQIHWTYNWPSIKDETINKLTNAEAKVKSEIVELKEKFTNSQTILLKYKEMINCLETQKQKTIDEKED